MDNHSVRRPASADCAAPPPTQPLKPSAPKAPYSKPEVHSDFAPLLALLTSGCDLDVTPGTGG